MNLFTLLAGVALGAAFSPFWMMVWNWVKTFVSSKFSK